MDPQAVADELRRRGLEVTTGATVIGSDEALREAVRLARIGGRQQGEHLRPRHINAGRLAESQLRLCDSTNLGASRGTGTGPEAAHQDRPGQAGDPAPAATDGRQAPQRHGPRA